MLPLHAYQRQTESTRQMLEDARSSLAAIDQGLERLAAREAALTAALPELAAALRQHWPPLTPGIHRLHELKPEPTGSQA